MRQEILSSCATTIDRKSRSGAPFVQRWRAQLASLTTPFDSASASSNPKRESPDRLPARCSSELLAQTGYPLQALAGAATTFELAYRALYVDKDDSRAKAWAVHNDLRYSYPPNLKAAMRTVYRERGEPEKTADEMYAKRYAPLAAAKHGNPRAMQQFGLQRGGDTLHIFLGPVDEPATTKACQIAMIEGVRLLGMVLGDLVDNHVRETNRAQFQKALNRVAGRVHRLLEALAKPFAKSP